MATVSKSMVAAVLAVRSGRLEPAAADRILAEGPDEDTRVRKLRQAAGADQFDDDPVFAPVDQIAQRLATGGDLADLVPDEPARRTLLSIVAARPEGEAVRETLLSLAPRPRDGAPSSQQPTQAGRGVTATRPSTRVLDLMTDSRQRYSVQREHARGGMGRILLARDNVVGREVALKELLPLREGSRPSETADSRGIAERFLREAKITGQLEHPNIVPVYEIGKHADESLYYTMKFVRGETLARKLARVGRDEALDRKQKLAQRLKLLDAFIDVCNAVAYAHSRGVIHRDLKPENIMVGEYGETVVLDWGLARVKGQEDTAARELMASTKHMSKSLLGDTGGNLTQHGAVVGTPAYMPPEQARGELETVDEQSDVYALGAVLYEILTGRPPFDGPVPGLIIQQVLHGVPLRVGAVVPEAPPELEALCAKAMAREKTARMATARELANELVAFRDGRTLSVYQYSTRELVARWVSRNRRAVVLGMLAAYLVVAAAVYHYFQLREEKRLVEEQKLQAENARASAEHERENARRQQLRAESALLAAESGERAARLAKDEAESATATAREEARQKAKALAAWDQTLADAYAMRVRLAIAERDYNAALAFAAAALSSAEQPEARGALVALPQVYPLIHELKPPRDMPQHLYEFYGVSFSPDGTLIAGGMPDGSCCVWDALTGELAATLPGGTASVYSAVFHPGGELLVTSDSHGMVRLYPVLPEQRRVLPEHRSFKCSGRVNVVSFRGDGRLVALGSSAAIELWDIHTLTRVATMAEPDHTPMFTAFSPDGRHVVSACLDQRPDQQAIRLWDAPGAALKSRLSGHTLSAGYLVFSPDGRTLASGSLDSTIRLWDMETETCRVVINDHGSFVLGLAFSPDGRTLASCSADSTVRLWDARNGEAIAVLSGFEGWVQSVAFSPDGSALAGRNAQGQVRVWRMQDRDRRTLADHGADVFDVRFSADGAYLVSASWDGTIRLRNARTFETTRVFRGHTGPVWSADLTPDNRTLISCGSDGTRVWDVETAVQRARVKPNELTVSTRVSPDGARFALSLWKRVYVFDVATLAQLAECNIHDEVTTECDWSPDGTMLASTSLDGTVRLWNAADGKPLRVLARGLGRVASVAFHPDGRHVATGAEDRVVRVLDVETGAVTRSLEGHEDAIFNVRFSPDGNLLFSSSGDRSIRIWRYADASTVAVLKSQRETVTRLAVHPRGTHLASGSQDDTVRIWPLWVLNVARDTVRDWAQLQTGLMVPEKSFVARRLPTWPAGLRDDYGAHDLRREHVRLAGLYAEFAHARFEGWRCEDVTGPDGKPARRYFPPRTRGPDGKLSGPPRGRVNYAAWWEDRHAAQLRAAWPRAPVVTEVLSEGQARELGLAEGDLLLRVDGVEVGDREQLRRLLDERQDRSCIVAVLRLARDERGQPVAAVNEQGDLRLDETGRTYWDGRRFEVELKPGRLGMRVGDAVWPPRPAR